MALCVSQCRSSGSHGWECEEANIGFCDLAFQAAVLPCNRIASSLPAPPPMGLFTANGIYCGAEIRQAALLLWLSTALLITH